MKWDIKPVVYGTEYVQQFLDDGWEPFSVTWTGEHTVIWFRKQA